MLYCTMMLSLSCTVDWLLPGPSLSHSRQGGCVGLVGAARQEVESRGNVIKAQQHRVDTCGQKSNTCQIGFFTNDSFSEH